MSRKNSFLQKALSKWQVLTFDILAIPVAWYSAFWLRFSMQAWPETLFARVSLYTFSLLFFVQIGCYYSTKMYRGLWRYSSMDDVIRIIRAVASAMAIVFPIYYLSSLLPNIPRSILPLYCFVLVTLLCGGRLLVRSVWDRKSKSDEYVFRVMVVGAGHAGASLIRDLKRSSAYLPIGLVDDDINKSGLEVHGVSVLGSIQQLSSLVLTHHIDLIFIAIPSAGSAVMRRVVEFCSQCKIPFHTLPSIRDLALGRVEVNALRKVNIEDLLGRDQVKINWDGVFSSIQNKQVLVTGGGGSIGSELCRQVMKLKPAQLVILDNSEFNLYTIGQELTREFPLIPFKLLLVNIADVIAVEQAFNQYKPNVVFHAAAYKHVPMLEHQIRAAVQNNVLGTQVVAKASVAIGAEKFILISTDKAVNPTNIMGTTKRVAEIYCQNLNTRVRTQFITVRFGNVLGSMGSVVPLFQQQLERGGPLTVTHKEMTRYFMTIPEACQLILQAMVNGAGGEIFVLDMGEPVKISYLAEQLIRLAGKEPGEDIAIEYTGLRPGEKLYEELFHASEELTKTEHEKLFKARFRKIDWEELLQTMRMLHKATATYNTDELFVLLKNLVPEFSTDAMADRSLEEKRFDFHEERDHATSK